MPGFYVERRTLPSGIPLSRDLAQHIFARGVHGSVVVVAERPQELASITKKQWQMLTRMVERERASTLNITRIAHLSAQIAWMQRVYFTCKLEDELPSSTLIFAAVADLIQKPPICSTLYITQPLNQKQFHLITSWLPSSSVVIDYG